MFAIFGFNETGYLICAYGVALITLIKIPAIKRTFETGVTWYGRGRALILLALSMVAVVGWAFCPYLNIFAFALALMIVLSGNAPAKRTGLSVTSAYVQ